MTHAQEDFYTHVENESCLVLVLLEYIISTVHFRLYGLLNSVKFLILLPWDPLVDYCIAILHAFVKHFQLTSVVEKVQAAITIQDVTSLDIYVKAEEGKAYYVVNDEAAGVVNLF